MNKYQPTSASDFIDFTSKIVNPLKFKNAVRRIDKGPVLWVGDIHGFYDNIISAIEMAKENAVSTVVFLGDYVDRGPFQTQSLINIAYSFARSEGYEGNFDFVDPLFQEPFPFKIIALRGNHEDILMNKKNEFQTELIEFYGKSDLKSILQSVEMLYDHLPIMTETAWGTLGVHGGIPEYKSRNQSNKHELMTTLRKLRIPMKSNPPHLLKLEHMMAMEQMLWNDPNENLPNEHIIFGQNIRGSDFRTFNQNAFEAFKEKFGYKRLVRGHQSSRGAFGSLWNDSLIHIVSAFPYFGKCETPAFFLEFEEGGGKIIDHKNRTLYSIFE